MTGRDGKLERCSRKCGAKEEGMGAYTKKLADFGSGLTYDAIPEKIRSRTKWLILDNLGIIIGATQLDFGKTLADYTRALGERKEATVLGFGIKSSARQAAFANGSFSETLEMQDGYTRGGYHPSCGTISASLAVAEWRGKTGKDLITGVVAGYEIGNRVAEAIHPTHLSRGFQPTGTAGTVGAAAAAAKIMGLNRDQIYHALTISGFILPISTGDNLWGGYSIKPVHGGAAAKSGIEAALLAQKGLEAAPLEGDSRIGKGFCRIVTDEEPRFEKMTEGLGENYTIEAVYFKPYASCRINQGPAEVALDLRKKYNLNDKEIQDVLIKTYDFAVKRTGSMRTDTHSPFTLCQFSMSYAVAGALMHGEVGLKQLTREKIGNPEIHSFASKIRVVADPELQKVYPASRPAVLEITTKDGRKLTGRADYAKGDHRNPMTEEEVRAKFIDLTREVIGQAKAKKAMDMALNVETLDTLEPLIRCLK
jgi:2-methylcitrate dehydratase PrpD